MRDLQRQHQAFSHRPDQGQYGDCWRTAVACVLRVERDFVTHVHRELEEPGAWKAWTDSVLKELGVGQVDVPFTGPEEVEFSDLVKWAWGVGGGRPFVLCGASPRGFNHATAILSPEELHDPNPEGGGLIGPCQPDGLFWASYFFSLESPQAVAQRIVAKRRFDDLL